MRDLVKHPVTHGEKMNCLTFLIEDLRRIEVAALDPEVGGLPRSILLCLIRDDVDNYERVKRLLKS